MTPNPTNDNEIYAYSQLSDTWYRVHDWEHVEDDRIVANSKEEIPREEVPDDGLDATDERPLDANKEPTQYDDDPRT